VRSRDSFALTSSCRIEMDKSPKICQILFDVDDEYKDSNLSFAVNYIAAHNFVQLSYTVVKYNED